MWYLLCHFAKKQEKQLLHKNYYAKSKDGDYYNKIVEEGKKSKKNLQKVLQKVNNHSIERNRKERLMLYSSERKEGK